MSRRPHNRPIADAFNDVRKLVFQHPIIGSLPILCPAVGCTTSTTNVCVLCKAYVCRRHERTHPCKDWTEMGKVGTPRPEQEQNSTPPAEAQP